MALLEKRYALKTCLWHNAGPRHTWVLIHKRGSTGCYVTEIQKVQVLLESCIKGLPKSQKSILQDCVMPRLSLADRHQAIGMLQAGMSQGEVAHFQCHRNTISALVRRHRERNDVTDQPRSGRPSTRNYGTPRSLDSSDAPQESTSHCSWHCRGDTW
jgi:hypothetical protein